MITRREFAMSSAAVLVLGGLGPLGGAAWAQTISVAGTDGQGRAHDIAMGSETRPRHHHRIRLDDLPALRRLRGHRFSPKLKEKYIDTGKVRFILREFPLDGLAAAAFMLARCAGPDKYYPMVETLFAQQAKWAVRNPIEPLMAIAKQAGFTQQTFEACINDKEALDQGPAGARPRLPEVQGQGDADFLHQRRAPRGRHVDRRARQGHRALPQDLIFVAGDALHFRGIGAGRRAIAAAMHRPRPDTRSSILRAATPPVDGRRGAHDAGRLIRASCIRVTARTHRFLCAQTCSG